MEFTTRFTDEYRQLLRDIAQNFTNNINRLLDVELRSSKYAKFTPKKLRNVACTKHGTSLLLENVLVNTPIIFEDPNIQVELLNECFSIDIKIKDLKLDADYVALNNEFFDMQITQFGKIEFQLKDIRVKGRISLFNKEDSFIPTHYDINYIIDNIETVTTSGAPVGQPCEHNCHNIKYAIDKVSANCVEDSMITYVWVELQQFIYERLQRLLDAIIVEYSFTELFLDEPEEYQIFETERKQYANYKFDLYLENLKKEYIKDATVDADPPLSVCFKSGADLCKLISSGCHLDDICTLRRVADASCYEDDSEQSFYCHVTMDAIAFNFDNFKLYSLSKDPIKGSVKLAPVRHKMFVKFQILKDASKGNCNVTLNLIAFEDVRVIEKKLTEHDSHAFQYTMNNLMPYLLGYVRYHTNEILQIYVNSFNFHYRDRS